MNHLANLSFLNNTYYALRHGESEGNVAGIIVSDPRIGVPKYGITETGRSQIRDSILRAMTQHLFDNVTIVVTSDFARAQESALEALSMLPPGRKPKTPLIATELRERFFGRYEGKSSSRYEDVWRRDAIDPDHTSQGVESANAVQDRTTRLISMLDKKHRGVTYILVSHGDALQILQTGFEKISASRHRWSPSLKNGELRLLQL